MLCSMCQLGVDRRETRKCGCGEVCCKHIFVCDRCGRRKPLSRGLRGFASVTPERHREIASMGGKAAHAPGAGGHEFSSEEAREAARKGHAMGRLHRFTTEEARIAGRKGGLARRERLGRPTNQSLQCRKAGLASAAARAAVAAQRVPPAQPVKTEKEV